MHNNKRAVFKYNIEASIKDKNIAVPAGGGAEGLHY